ncbi:AraC family transcriptional regulator [Roseibium marinum]|uniref:AraC family transcriptional regulator n=1 Tax=Roseibium marinum TaxID=281252 RepID=UPI0014762AE1|nr:AraC family transcriptional regulator [Roseibium marinum]
MVSIISDRSFPRHTHDEYGIGFMVSGGHESWSGRGHVEASTGDVITVNPGEVHDGLGRKGAPRQWKMLFLDLAIIGRYAETDRSGQEFTNPVLSDRQTCAAIAQAVTALSSPTEEEAFAEECLILALAAIGKVPVHRGKTGRPDYSWAVRCALDKIAAEADGALNLADLADAAGVSRFQLLRRFSAEVGTTPHNYLIQYRVNLARRKIRAGHPLAEAAVSSGFADQSHMTRAFVRQYGLSPGHFTKDIV